MSWFRRGHGQKPDYTALEIQTSASTMPISIVYGRNKVAGNILWDANFQAVAGGGGKGSGKGSLTGGGGGAQSYTYKADLIIGVCEGPISGFGIVYKDQLIYFLFQLGLGSFNGTTPQDVWPYLDSEIEPSGQFACRSGHCLCVGRHASTLSMLRRSATTISSSPAPSAAAGQRRNRLTWFRSLRLLDECAINQRLLAALDQSSALFCTNDASRRPIAIRSAYAFRRRDQSGAGVVSPELLAALERGRGLERRRTGVHPDGETAVASGASTTYQNQFRSRRRSRFDRRRAAFVILAMPTQS